jgi:hypothetical protein
MSIEAFSIKVMVSYNEGESPDETTKVASGTAPPISELQVEVMHMRDVLLQHDTITVTCTGNSRECKRRSAFL